MINDRFAQLIARKLSGEATPEEVRELESLLKEHPESHYFFELFSDYWSISPKTANDNIQEEIHFQQILAIAENGNEETPASQNPVEKGANVFRMRKILAAASILGIIACVYFFARSLNSGNNGELALNEVTAKPGSRIYLLLPDGSKVWLNSESKLEYKSDFNDSVREVTLEGEAFFDVVKDKKHPFIVHTSDIDVRVLGTAFNVKSYPKESFIEATLIRGLIEVTNKKNPTSPKVILYPHNKLVFNKEASVIPSNIPPKAKDEVILHKPFAITALPKNVSDTALVETSWIYNKLLFDGETLRQNATKLERWYNVKIHFRDDKVGNTPIRYPLSNETIEEALKALQYIEPFNYKINDNQIEIWEK
jgi:ferric-dicitrate binding protein FerR (iron transport regulator)